MHGRRASHHAPSAKRHDLPDWLAEALARDPAFRVLTMDGTGWIDPFTGAVVPCPFGHDDIARTYLLRTQPWTHLKPKPVEELLAIRWQMYLRSSIETQPNLRIIREGQWLNPYTGAWVAGIAHPAGGPVTAAVADAIAQILAGCPEAQAGKMLEPWQLETLAARGPGQGPEVLREIVAKPLVARPVRAKTDYHDIKQGFLKMLARPPRVEGFQFVVQYEPHAAVSHDFYDFIQLDRGRLLVALGDCTAIGPGSALLAGTVLHALRRIAPIAQHPVEITAQLNDEVRPDLYHGSSIGLYLALIDIPARTATCLCAGHEAAVLLAPRRDSMLTLVSTPGGSLGALAGNDLRATLSPVTVQLDPGDILILASNGLFQVANPDDHEAGRLAVLGACVANAKLPCARLVGAVMETARGGHQGQPAEDMTMVAVRVKDDSWLLELDERQLK